MLSHLVSPDHLAHPQADLARPPQRFARAPHRLGDDGQTLLRGGQQFRTLAAETQSHEKGTEPGRTSATEGTEPRRVDAVVCESGTAPVAIS